MGFKLQSLCAAAFFLSLMKAVNIRAQCTPPSFASKNVILSYPWTQSFADGSSVTFECMIGHKPVNSRASKSVTCQGTQWTNLELDCIRKSCGSPRDFYKGKYEISGILFGDKITAVCDKGYILYGQMKDRWCRDQGWDGRDPVCEVVKCVDPPTIENGQLGDDPLGSYDYSQVVSYKCNNGFSLFGSSTLRCSEDGTFKPDPPKCLAEGWSPEPPQCIAAKCQAPPIIENGQIESVSYKCNSGFLLIGSSQLYRSEDGTFKPDPPKCLDGCPTPEIPHAIRIGGRSPPYKLGNFIDYKCEDGYTMKGEYHIVCSAEGWSPEPPQCIGIKYLPPQHDPFV